MKMKTNFKTILFCTALLALPLGCRKGMDTQDKGEVLGDGFEVTVKETLKGADGTKTYLIQDGEIAWSDKDTVLVIGKTTAQMLVVPLGTDATHGFLTKITDDMPLPATTGKAYTALYPASMFAGATAADIAGTLPTVYTYSAYGLDPLKIFPMYAQSADRVLEFKSVLGLLQMNVRGTMTVTKIEVSSSTDNLAGAFSIDPETGGITFTGTEKKVTIDCGTDGVALNGNDGVKFFLPLAPDTYNDIKVRIYTKEMDEKGGSCEHISKEVEIKRCTVHQATFKAERDAVQLWPGGPKWATANLGAACKDDAASWYGNYYMWGETAARTSDFTWTAYRTIDNFTPASGDATVASEFERYNVLGSTLTDVEDAAVQTWGNGWRMPTTEEFKALDENCSHSWESDYEGTGVAGMLFTSNADATKTLFFPAAGYGDGSNVGNEGGFWTKTLAAYPAAAYRLRVNSSDAYAADFDNRCNGHSIRPVHD